MHPPFFKRIFICLSLAAIPATHALGVLKAQSSPPNAVTNSGGSGMSRAAAGPVGFALPPAPAPAATSKVFISTVPINLSVLNLYLLVDPQAQAKITTFCAGIRPFYVSGQSYQGQTASGRFLLSLTVLGRILEEGPQPEYKALRISSDQSSNQSNPEEILTVSRALALAVADLNTLAKEVYLESPSLLKKPNEFVKFIRKYLLWFKKAEKQIVLKQH